MDGLTGIVLQLRGAYEADPTDMRTAWRYAYWLEQAADATETKEKALQYGAEALRLREAIELAEPESAAAKTYLAHASRLQGTRIAPSDPALAVQLLQNAVGGYTQVLGADPANPVAASGLTCSLLTLTVSECADAGAGETMVEALRHAESLERTDELREALEAVVDMLRVGDLPEEVRSARLQMLRVEALILLAARSDPGGWLGRLAAAHLHELASSPEMGEDHVLAVADALYRLSLVMVHRGDPHYVQAVDHTLALLEQFVGEPAIGNASPIGELDLHSVRREHAWLLHVRANAAAAEGVDQQLGRIQATIDACERYRRTDPEGAQWLPYVDALLDKRRLVGQEDDPSSRQPLSRKAAIIATENYWFQEVGIGASDELKTTVSVALEDCQNHAERLALSQEIKSFHQSQGFDRADWEDIRILADLVDEALATAGHGGTPGCVTRLGGEQ